MDDVEQLVDKRGSDDCDDGGFVGLDLSLTGTGIVYLDPGGDLVHSDKVGYGLSRDVSDRESIERLLYIRGRISDVVKKYSPSAVYAEAYAYGMVGSQNDLGELHGVVMTMLWERYTLPTGRVAPNTARKHVLGRGNLSKDDVLSKLRSAGLDFRSHDEADAYVVAKYAFQQTE